MQYTMKATGSTRTKFNNNKKKFFFNNKKSWKFQVKRKSIISRSIDLSKFFFPCFALHLCQLNADYLKGLLVNRTTSTTTTMVKTKMLLMWKKRFFFIYFILKLYISNDDEEWSGWILWVGLKNPRGWFVKIKLKKLHKRIKRCFEKLLTILTDLKVMKL